MRMLAVHCQGFDYVVQEPCGLAAEIDPEQIGKPVSVGPCLFVLATIEPRDMSKLNRAAKSLASQADRCGVTHIVINAFVHLVGAAEPVAAPEVSQAVLDQLLERLQQKQLTGRLLPFGWSKRMALDVLGGQFDQRYLQV